jgi:hypothetical protein
MTAGRSDSCWMGGRETRGHRSDADGARLAAPRPAPDRHQGRLRRGRLRRLHRGRRAARRGGCAMRRSTPASASCRRWTAAICSPSRASEGDDGALHPVQQAMVDKHGSQCGFCTPGFVMSLFALWLNEDAPSIARMRMRWPATSAAAPAMSRSSRRPGRMGGRASGPIRAPPRAVAKPAGPLDRGPDAGAGHPGSRFLRRAAEAGRSLCLPIRSDIVAGATDVGLWVTKGMRRLDPVISLGRIEELRELARRG